MEPQQHNYENSSNLPPLVDLPNQLTTAEHSGANKPEVIGNQSPPMSQATAQQANPQNFVDPFGASAGSVPTPTPPVPQTTNADNLIADDADLIEKEWVSRAKNIVMQTKNDPYSQNREMNKVKADYLKKRYNKDIKLSED